MNLPRNEFRMSITSSCNMQCTYCHNEGNVQSGRLSIDDIEKIVNAAKEYGIEEVRLTGGDPMVHPQIYEICDILHNKYGLRISINTNCVSYQKLKTLIMNGWINRVVVGLDYFDSAISKDSSIGVSSSVILDRILDIKNNGCDVSISTVFNDDYDNKKNIVDWCVKNGIRVKIIEIEKNEVYFSSDVNYLKMQHQIINGFKFDTIVIDELGEYNCYINNKKIVSFFPSFCRLRRCDLCKKIQMRITSSGFLKPCLYYDDQDEKIVNCSEKEIARKIGKVLKRTINYHIDNNCKKLSGGDDNEK